MNLIEDKYILLKGKEIVDTFNSEREANAVIRMDPEVGDDWRDLRTQTKYKVKVNCPHINAVKFQQIEGPIHRTKVTSVGVSLKDISFAYFMAQPKEGYNKCDLWLTLSTGETKKAQIVAKEGYWLHEIVEKAFPGVHVGEITKEGNIY